MSRVFRRHEGCSLAARMLHETQPDPDDSTRDHEDAAWPRGLQLFALLAFAVNLGAAVYLVA